MDRSVAQGHPEARVDGWTVPGTAGWLAAAIGGGIALLALAVYTATVTAHGYEHFVWQAAAFLEGQAAIRYPTSGNWYYQDVLPVAPGPDGIPRGLIPFPPLPALVLLPFVAARGLATDSQLVFAVLGAIAVGGAWWMLGRLPIGLGTRVATTLFLAFGTVFWYSAQLATTWYQAHILAVGLAVAAIGVALGADPGATGRSGAAAPAAPPAAGDRPRGRADRLRGLLAVDGRQFAAGLLFGLACTSRLTVVFAAPFFMLVGGGGGWWRRSWSAGLGAIGPVAALVVYNLATTGSVMHPAYEHLYLLEATFYPSLGYRANWAIEDVRYIPQNLGIMFGTPPILFPATLPDSLGVSATPVCTEPGAVRGLFDLACPLAVPSDVGMSVLLTSPAYLLAAPALRRIGTSRLVAGATIAVLLVATVNLMHFSQGWVQFGYRFANDLVPWALLLIALGAGRLARRPWGPPLVAGLVLASILVNLWGVAWGRLLGW